MKLLAIGGALVALVVGFGAGYVTRGQIHHMATSAAARPPQATPDPSPSQSASPLTYTVSGTMELAQGSGDFLNYGVSASGHGPAHCHGQGGYSDVVRGAEVTIYNASNDVIGTGSLGIGSPDVSSQKGGCTFLFSVSDVPYSKFYGIQVTHRGTIDEPFADATNGNVELGLGS